MLLLCGAIIFYRTEQNAVQRSRLDDQHVREHNELLKKKNDDLKNAKSQLLKDEEEYVAELVYQCAYFLLHLVSLPVCVIDLCFLDRPSHDKLFFSNCRCAFAISIRLTKMYEKWLADDGKSLEISRAEIKELNAQIEAVKASQQAHESLLGDKADALANKEDILMVHSHTAPHQQQHTTPPLLAYLCVSCTSVNSPLVSFCSHRFRCCC